MKTPGNNNAFQRALLLVLVVAVILHAAVAQQQDGTPYYYDYNYNGQGGGGPLRGQERYYFRRIATANLETSSTAGEELDSNEEEYPLLSLHSSSSYYSSSPSSSSLSCTSDGRTIVYTDGYHDQLYLVDITDPYHPTTKTRRGGGSGVNSQQQQSNNNNNNMIVQLTKPTTTNAAGDGASDSKTSNAMSKIIPTSIAMVSKFDRDYVIVVSKLCEQQDHITESTEANAAYDDDDTGPPLTTKTTMMIHVVDIKTRTVVTEHRKTMSSISTMVDHVVHNDNPSEATGQQQLNEDDGEEHHMNDTITMMIYPVDVSVSPDGTRAVIIGLVHEQVMSAEPSGDTDDMGLGHSTKEQQQHQQRNRRRRIVAWIHELNSANPKNWFLHDHQLEEKDEESNSSSNKGKQELLLVELDDDEDIDVLVTMNPRCISINDNNVAIITFQQQKRMLLVNATKTSTTTTTILIDIITHTVLARYNDGSSSSSTNGRSDGSDGGGSSSQGIAWLDDRYFVVSGRSTKTGSTTNDGNNNHWSIMDSNAMVDAQSHHPSNKKDDEDDDNDMVMMAYMNGRNDIGQDVETLARRYGHNNHNNNCKHNQQQQKPAASIVVVQDKQSFAYGSSRYGGNMIGGGVGVGVGQLIFMNSQDSNLLYVYGTTVTTTTITTSSSRFNNNWRRQRQRKRRRRIKDDHHEVVETAATSTTTNKPDKDKKDKKTTKEDKKHNSARDHPYGDHPPYFIQALPMAGSFHGAEDAHVIPHRHLLVVMTKANERSNHNKYINIYYQAFLQPNYPTLVSGNRHDEEQGQVEAHGAGGDNDVENVSSGSSTTSPKTRKHYPIPFAALSGLTSCLNRTVIMKTTTTEQRGQQRDENKDSDDDGSTTNTFSSSSLDEDEVKVQGQTTQQQQQQHGEGSNDADEYKGNEEDEEVSLILHEKQKAEEEMTTTTMMMPARKVLKKDRDLDRTSKRMKLQQEDPKEEEQQQQGRRRRRRAAQTNSELEYQYYYHGQYGDDDGSSIRRWIQQRPSRDYRSLLLSTTTMSPSPSLSPSPSSQPQPQPKGYNNNNDSTHYMYNMVVNDSQQDGGASERGKGGMKKMTKTKNDRNNNMKKKSLSSPKKKMSKTNKTKILSSRRDDHIDDKNVVAAASAPVTPPMTSIGNSNNRKKTKTKIRSKKGKQDDDDDDYDENESHKGHDNYNDSDNDNSPAQGSSSLGSCHLSGIVYAIGDKHSDDGYADEHYGDDIGLSNNSTYTTTNSTATYTTKNKKTRRGRGGRRILTIDTTTTQPPAIVSETYVMDADGILERALHKWSLSSMIVDAFINNDGTINANFEGISMSRSGGFWLVHQGTTGLLSHNGLDDDDTEIDNDDSATVVTTPNLLLKIDENAVIQSVITLPTDENDDGVVSFDDQDGATGRGGVQGVAEDRDFVVVVYQHPMKGDDHPLIGVYDTKYDVWGFVYYPMDDHLHGHDNDNNKHYDDEWVGLSEITSLGYGFFLVLESDHRGGVTDRQQQQDQQGTSPVVKRIYMINLNEPEAQYDTLNKYLVRDIYDDLVDTTNGPVVQKVEGMTVDSQGYLWIVNDNIVVFDHDNDVGDGGGCADSSHTEETLFLNLGKLTLDVDDVHSTCNEVCLDHRCASCRPAFSTLNRKVRR